jgi:hypothetical protein
MSRHPSLLHPSDIPIAAAAAPLTRPSGRFDALVDMDNPMKGINLFPYLRRRVEGRALRAMGPCESLELSRTVCEAAAPRRWPRAVHIFIREERIYFYSLIMCLNQIVLIVLLFSLTAH